MELPPRSPAGAEQVGGRTTGSADTFACHLPLHDQVGALEPARVHVEQSAKDGARDAERQVGEDPVRIGRERHVPRVRTRHGDVPYGREPLRQHRHELGIDLEREHLTRAVRERIGERAATRSELDHAIVAGDAGVGDELGRESRATEEVLAAPTPSGASGRCVPGHG